MIVLQLLIILLLSATIILVSRWLGQRDRNSDARLIADAAEQLSRTTEVNQPSHTVPNWLRIADEMKRASERHGSE